MPTTIINDGQIARDTVIGAGDSQELRSDAQNVATAGQSFNATVNSGGLQWINYGAAHDTVVFGGGTQTLYVQGATYGTVLNGGTLVHYGSAASATYNTVVNNGGLLMARGPAHDTVINGGGTVDVQLSGETNFAGAISNTVVHAGGTLQIGASTGAGSVTGTQLFSGSAIILPVQFQSGATTVSLDAGRNILTVTNGATNYSLGLTGNYQGVTFTVEQAGGSISSKVNVGALCFCRGTRVATPRGEVAVEALRVGDEVVTVSGRVRRVRWIGTTAGIVGPESRPVIVRRGALDGRVPTRDLRVTPGHSFLFGDVLIPIGKLVNGGSVAWDRAARTVKLFHVELDVHAVILAEGAPAESYRDDGNRVGFASPGGGRAAGTMPTCAPVVAAGPVVERTRRYLARLAAAADARAAA